MVGTDECVQNKLIVFMIEFVHVEQILFVFMSMLEKNKKEVKLERKWKSTCPSACILSIF